MATIKPDTRLKDQLIKQEAARVAHRATRVKALNTLLVSLPKVDLAMARTAVDALMFAADQYKASQPLVDPKGRRSKPTLAKGRASLANLQKHLAKAHEQLSNLPLDAMTAIGKVTGAPISKMRAELEQVRHAVAQTQAELAARPHKVADTARNVLAYQVAVVFRDILKKAPSTTRAKQLKDNKSRGGAAYDRVLRATLQAAGVTDYDSGPLISAGLRLLKDPNLPAGD